VEMVRGAITRIGVVMRSRNIKPGLFKNEILGTEDPMLTVLFVGLWCLADRRGRLEDRPLRIKAEVFPYRDGLDINGYLTVLSRLEFIQRYEVEGRAYIQIVNFEKHQKPHHTEKESNIPPLPNNGETTVNTPCVHALIPDSLVLIPEEKSTPPTSPPQGGDGLCSPSGQSPASGLGEQDGRTPSAPMPPLIPPSTGGERARGPAPTEGGHRSAPTMDGGKGAGLRRKGPKRVLTQGQQKRFDEF